MDNSHNWTPFRRNSSFRRFPYSVDDDDDDGDDDDDDDDDDDNDDDQIPP